jgi:hypothetical protein
MQYRSLLAAAALAAGSVVSAAAIAATSAGVRIEAPRITLSDLDASDRRSPRLAPGGTRVAEFDQYLEPAPVGVDLFGAAEITADDEQSIGGRTMGRDSGFLVVGDRYAPSFTFTVGPRSGVTVEAPYSFSTSMSGEAYDAAAALPRTSASFELMLVAVNNFVPGDAGHDLLAVETDYAELASPLDRAPSMGSFSRTGVLSVSFDNASDGDAVFAFRGQMVAYGVSGSMAPVPEPQSWALMLAGLALMAAIARRRPMHST